MNHVSCIYLGLVLFIWSNIIFVIKGSKFRHFLNRVDGTFLANIKMEVQGPKIHYVYPNCFVAGKSMEFIVCGSNLLRHKFRYVKIAT